MHRNVTLGLLLATLIALVLRCPDLSVRPMHNDEAVNAIKLQSLLGQGSYRYDPNEHHGPALYYAAFAWMNISGVTESAQLSEARLRVMTVLFGLGLILLLPLVADGLGRGAMIWSAILIAVSPAMVFYSRYFIHEMLLVFFTFLALAAFWRHYRSGKIYWAILCGVSAGLMQSTKETFVLSVGAAGVALLLNKLWTHSGDAASAKPRKAFKPVALCLLAWCIVAVVFFSSFFTNAGGVLDSIRTYLPWLDRAAGNSPHIHPWNFYLSRLAWFHVQGGPVWSEGFILALAVIGVFVAFTGRGRTGAKQNFLRFVALYTLTLTLLYSSIAYKTPWCLLNFWHGAILLAGTGAVAMWRLAKHRWMKIVVGLLLFAGTDHLAFQAWQAGGNYSADRRNPYVYAQTSPDIFGLIEKVNALAQASPQRLHLSMSVSVPENDYWPLPYYLRAFDQVGWLNELPGESLAPVMIVSTQFTVKMDERKSHLAAGLFELRPGVFLALYVEPELWQVYLKSKPSGQ